VKGIKGRRLSGNLHQRRMVRHPIDLNGVKRKSRQATIERR